MKQIALMGLMAAVLAVGVYSCSGGADTTGDGSTQDTGNTGGGDSSEAGDIGQDVSTGGDEYRPDGSMVADGGTECDGDVTWLCVPGSAGGCCGDSGAYPRCYDGVPTCPSGMIPEYQCTCGQWDTGQPPNDGGIDGGEDGGTDSGSTDTGIVINCGPSPTGKGGDMCDVPAGPFTMGCNVAVDTECQSDENPYHAVNVPAFKIDKYELTMGEYQVCVDAGACTADNNGGSCNYGVSGRDSHPINCVDWDQAKAFCAWAGKRLPTEAEWEKAARGTDERKYPWGNDALDCDHAVHSANGCSDSSTAPVGSKPSGVSPYGAEDMVGNVIEWVEDWYHDTYTGAPSDGSAWVTPTGSYRVVRGGSWYSGNTYNLRASGRGSNDPTRWFANIGFRCAMSVP